MYGISLSPSRPVSALLPEIHAPGMALLCGEFGLRHHHVPGTILSDLILSSRGVSRLQLGGPTLPACLPPVVQMKFYQNPPGLICVASTAVLQALGQSWCLSQSVWSPKPQIFTIWPFTEFANPVKGGTQNTYKRISPLQGRFSSLVSSKPGHRGSTKRTV